MIKIKVLHVISGDGGGISSYIKNLVKENNDIIDFHVLSFSNYLDEFIYLNRCHKVELHKMPRLKDKGNLQFIKYLYDFFKKNQFDYIVCHIPGIYSIPFKLMSYLNGTKKFSVHSHQTQLVYGRKKTLVEKIVNILNPYINRLVSDLYLACGNEAANYAFGKDTKSKVRIIYNSIDIDKFFGNDSKIDSGNEEIVIGHIGRHTEAKNLPFIIELAKFLKKHQTENKYRIIMVGDGQLTDKFKATILNEKLENEIKLVGRKQNVEDYFELFDLTILPSLSEGLPTVAIESQASGTPIICSNNITKEIDLELGLVKYLPINNDYNTMSLWKSVIDEAVLSSKLDRNLIKKSLKLKEFDSKSMYLKFYSVLLEVVN